MARKKKLTLILCLNPCRALFILLVILCVGSCRTDEVLFSRDVSPILYKNCVKCHNSSGMAPFPLITYHDVVKRAVPVSLVTARRQMPPWPAEPGYGHFKDELFLAPEDLALIQQWVKQKCPPGDTTNLPALPPLNTYSFVGKPDLSLSYKDTVFLKGDYTDRFFLIKIPYEIPSDTIAAVIEFIPGNRKAVHHVNGHLITYANGVKKNVFEGLSYIETNQGDADSLYRALKVANDDGGFGSLSQSVVNYLPGVLPTVYPDDFAGIRLPSKGAFLFKDIHYGPVGRDTFDVSRLNIFFGKHMPGRITRELQMGTLGITDIEPPLVIPPNEIKTFVTRALIKIDISLLTINPHMHKLGKSFHAYAIKPDGDTIPLIRIPAWDFNWQFFYTFRHPVKIPAGSRMEVVGVFDNTIHNKNNPFHPPRMVMERKGSMLASDEMFQFIVTLVDYREGDEAISLE